MKIILYNNRWREHRCGNLPMLHKQNLEPGWVNDYDIEWLVRKCVKIARFCRPCWSTVAL